MIEYSAFSVVDISIPHIYLFTTDALEIIDKTKEMNYATLNLSPRMSTNSNSLHDPRFSQQPISSLSKQLKPLEGNYSRLSHFQ